MAVQGGRRRGPRRGAARVSAPHRRQPFHHFILNHHFNQALLESLLATAASPALCAERHVSQEEALKLSLDVAHNLGAISARSRPISTPQVLKLSLDVAHKSAWRLGDSARGRAARSERLARASAY